MTFNPAATDLATALALGHTRHRGRPWGSPARILLAPCGEPSVQTPRRSPARRVLCTDRDAAAAEALARARRGTGFEARGCGDGPAALVEVTDFRPHACVLDTDTPGVGGLELALWVRAELGPLTLLIGVTDWTAADQEAADAGFDLLFARPADPELLAGFLAGHAGHGHR